VPQLADAARSTASSARREMQCQLGHYASPHLHANKVNAREPLPTPSDTRSVERCAPSGHRRSRWQLGPPPHCPVAATPPNPTAAPWAPTPSPPHHSGCRPLRPLLSAAARQWWSFEAERAGRGGAPAELCRAISKTIRPLPLPSHTKKSRLLPLVARGR
jgi:hypothetical protein